MNEHGGVGSCGRWLLAAYVRLLALTWVALEYTHPLLEHSWVSHDTVDSGGRCTVVAFGMPSWRYCELYGSQY